MTETVQTIADRTAVVLDVDGPTLDTAMLANDLIGLTWQHEADLLIVPASRLPHDFFVLRTGVLGEAAQKLTNYHVQMAVVGNVSQYTEASSAFGDFLRETNAGGTLWFVPDMSALERRLER